MTFRPFLCIIPVLLVVAGGCATAISEYPVTSRDKQQYSSRDINAKDYEKATYVLQTKGGGELACINIGSDNGVLKGSKIDFFEKKIKNGRKFDILFAKGKVVDVSKNTCWVQVNSYETAGVMENHFARLSSDQAPTLGEKFANPTLFFKKKKPAPAPDKQPGKK